MATSPPLRPPGARPVPLADGALFVFALGLAVLDLGTRSLHELDVARWGTLAREMLRTGDVLVPTRYGEIYANKPPLYLWIVAGTSALAGGVTPFLVRLPSALGFTLLVVATARWARTRTGSTQVGLMAGLLALSTFGLAWLGREGRLDMFGAGLAVAGTAALDAARRDGGRRAAWAAGLWLGAAVLVKGPPLLVAPVALLLLDRAPRRLPPLMPVLLPLVGLPLLWLVPAAIQGGTPYLKALVVDQIGDRVSGDGNHKQAAWYYLAMLPAQFAPWGPGLLAVAVAGLVPAWRRRLGSVAGLATAGAATLLVFSAIPTKHVRYLAPVVPLLLLPLAAVVGAWLDGPDVRARWRVHRRAAAGLALLGAAGLVVLGMRSTRDAVPWIVLATALATLGVAMALRRTSTPIAERRRWASTLLLAAALLVAGTGVFRYRFVVRDHEAFNRELAAALRPDDAVVTLEPMTPENVFHGAPDARMVLRTEDLDAPAAGALVVVYGRDMAPAAIAEAERAMATRLGPGDVVVAPREGHGYRARRFRPPGPR